MKPISLQQDVNLLHYNTFKFPCIARYFVEIENSNDLIALMQMPVWNTTPNKLMLWWWSNILLATEYFDGLVIKQAIKGKTLIEQTDRTVTIEVWWWEEWHWFVERSIDQWYYGIENLIAIPWSVGAAPMQNIWAYGVEVCSVIDAVTYIDLEYWTIHTIDKSACQFWYRQSLFKQALRHKICILSVTFTLGIYNNKTYKPLLTYAGIQETLKQQWSDTDAPTPRNVADAIATIRAEKLPDRHRIGTAWSFFKNPLIPEKEAHSILTKHPTLKTYPAPHSMVKFSAWELIDRAWCKWFTQWAVGTYNKHALVLIHRWWAQWTELLALAQTIQNRVYKMFGIMLDMEVNLIE